MICLDTNAVIAVLSDRASPVRVRIDAAIGLGHPLAISSIVLFELRYGAAKSARPERSGQRIVDFLAGPIEVLPFAPADAEEAGHIHDRVGARGNAHRPLRHSRRRTSAPARRPSRDRERARIRPCAAAEV